MWPRLVQVSLDFHGAFPEPDRDSFSQIGQLSKWQQGKDQQFCSRGNSHCPSNELDANVIIINKQAGCWARRLPD